ncbi:transposase [Frankia sp. AgB32]|uniref:transposase n=1 Tax=Frankia sp. AgB32 TaxID=631119 RepID=UPI00200BFD11|nr:transposase [Frankia sp. AgB32]MCK9897222.1 transposase [Frankia sp. AgB32]
MRKKTGRRPGGQAGHPGSTAQVAGASIFFGDEASVRTDFHAGTTWAPVGQTPIVRGTGNRKSVNMISAVSAQGKLHFSLIEGTTTSATFIEFCTQLLHDIDGPVYLIVDGHGAHKSAATRAYVKSTEGRLKIFVLRPTRPNSTPTSGSGKREERQSR